MNSSALRSVTVLAGGISHERDVSLRSGRRVVDSLTSNGIAVDLRDPDATLLGHLTESRPDVVWPALHGASGEDGALRGLLEALDIPFVGSTSAAARLAWDKPTAKELARRAGVLTPRGITLSHDAFRELGAAGVLAAIADEHPVPVVVKPARGGSAQGVTVVDDADGLPRAMVDAYTYCDDVIVEQKITGTEIAVGVIDTGDGPTALPAVEIVPRNGIYGFEARYNAGETTFYTPARLEPDAADAAARAAVTVHEALGLRHLSRVDLIVDAAGAAWFLEVNVLPGLTETSLVPMALDAAGYELGMVYAALAEKAVADHH
ncbi:D-alanine--D-alanine ligase family protein [Frigoribacterium faeni]|uniref:D-alanine--D-alanine ligase n=1 Tax=Frigoribacterium faeni TaxID=145483 RepID=A0A7W3PJY9_9MICO|nr:D-alanine--D-alanine ligase [Frigoribacterium faeni]MBA8814421.1 D-alanine-D-alanine ligase [Frigoribacterium faeni]BFF15792.1 D-alanine--D-alanine ligase [Microbacterium flavescens]GEK84074.1 D-alanine--D-alanine ligase [Frigoribacterium faeni]